MNDFSNVKVIVNPIRSQHVQVTVKNNKGQISCEVLPSQIDFTNGLWQVKVHSVVVDNYFDRIDPKALASVFDIRTSLISTYEQRGPNELNAICPELLKLGNFSKFLAKQLTLFSINLVWPKANKQHSYFDNKTHHWFTIEAKPFNSFDVFVCARNRMPIMPPDSILNFDIEFLFQRIK